MTPAPPANLPMKWDHLWARPWKVPRSRLRKRAFKRWLWRNGLVSVHFTRTEAERSATCGRQPIADQHRNRAQKHAFKLERVRHRAGDRPLTFISWNRNPSCNATVGGVPNSQHLNARATDVQTPHSAELEAALRREFRTGGIGTDSHTGQVAHVDSRGYPARWTYR